MLSTLKLKHLLTGKDNALTRFDGRRSYIKTFLMVIPLCLLALLVSCGNIEDSQVAISYGEAKKSVRLGDYYWVQQTEGKVVVAADSKMNPVGLINGDDNPSDYNTVVRFLKKSTK